VVSISVVPRMYLSLITCPDSASAGHAPHRRQDPVASGPIQGPESSQLETAWQHQRARSLDAAAQNRNTFLPPPPDTAEISFCAGRGPLLVWALSETVTFRHADRPSQAVSCSCSLPSDARLLLAHPVSSTLAPLDSYPLNTLPTREPCAPKILLIGFYCTHGERTVAKTRVWLPGGPQPWFRQPVD
jgi:hypothetical protein